MKRDYEYYDELDLDTFESMRPRAHAHSGSRFTRKEKPQYRNLVSLRRNTGPQDSLRIAPAVNKAVSSIGPTLRRDLIIYQNGHGVSTITPNDCKRIFGFNNQDGLVFSARSFNRVVRDYRGEINARNENIFVQLGKVAIFGKTRNEAGVRYVGYDLAGEGLEVLVEEQAELGRRLIPDSMPHLKNVYVENCRPHVSVLRTRSQEAAEAAMSVIQGVGLESAWIQLRKADTRVCTLE